MKITPYGTVTYYAEFSGVEDVILPKDKSSVKWRFAWKVLTGEYAGKIASALTDRAISPTTLPGRLIAGLMGRELVTGENVKNAIDAFLGETYLVSVQCGPQGGKPGVRMVSQPPAM